MHIKKSLSLTFHRLFLHLKSLKFLFFVPLTIIDGLMLFLNFSAYKTYGISEQLMLNLMQYSQYFIPFFSVWWSLFIARQYTESDGNEMLYVNKSKSKLLDLALPFTLFMLNATAIYLVYIHLFDGLFYEYIKLLIVCIFSFCITYFMIFTSGSITIALLVLVMYLIANLGLTSNTLYFPFYYSLEGTDLELITHHYLPMLALGLVLLGIGYVFSRNRTKFN